MKWKHIKLVVLGADCIMLPLAIIQGNIISVICFTVSITALIMMELEEIKKI